MTELFVYGTLKQGGKWHHMMSGSDFLGLDTIQGEMFVDDYFPYLFNGTDIISGEVYDVRMEDYERIAAMEGDEYGTSKVTTGKNRQIVVFTAVDNSKRNPKNRITNFDAAAYFKKWLEDTPRDSDSWQEFVELGGQEPNTE